MQHAGRYIYHRVPNNISGQTLYPLNRLKAIYPELYAATIKHYAGREWVMKMRIPILDCLWNDVLHFSPVHPAKIRDGLVTAGFPRKTRTYFEIDPEQIRFNSENAVIFRHKLYRPDQHQLPAADFEPFQPASLARLTGVPPATLAYYKESRLKGQPALTYLYVPHILFKGTVDIHMLNVIEVR
jgi:hypothetical protein